VLPFHVDLAREAWLEDAPGIKASGSNP
jgi:hypothetical protein